MENLNAAEALQIISLELIAQAGQHRQSSARRADDYKGNLKRSALWKSLRLAFAAEALEHFSNILDKEKLLILENPQLGVDKIVKNIRLALIHHSEQHKQSSAQRAEDYRNTYKHEVLWESLRLAFASETLINFSQALTEEKLLAWKAKQQ